MTYPEAIKFLYGLSWFGARFGLEPTRVLAERVGNPQNRLRFIHVAGTNGKGSTCAMLESIYRAAGLRVGLFTSPHLVSFRERIQVNRQLISQADVVRLVAELQVQLPHDSTTPTTLFEFVTVLALRYFEEQKCDLVIWETGLGGRLDATNIVTPLASVITNIGYDHQQWLGDTLARIAREKAGIIKPGVPVVTAVEQSEVLQVLEAVALEQRAPLSHVTGEMNLRGKSALLGAHQKINAALALATVQILQPQLPVTAATSKHGLETVQWPGRLQLITRPNGQRYLLDGAHNVAGVEVLRTALLQGYLTVKLTLIIGMLGDKDWRVMCQLLAPLAARIFAVPVSSERTVLPQDLAEVCRAANPKAVVQSYATLVEALRAAEQDSFVVIAGSLYLIGAALALLDPEFSTAGDERALNEWSGPKASDSSVR
ncbi:MAG: folylpolyglutamate synthase/dihydrofolate synthase family protein [Verrucomicrobiota bacterium]